MPKGSEEQSDKQAHGAQQASLHPLSDVCPSSNHLGSDWDRFNGGLASS